MFQVDDLIHMHALAYSALDRMLDLVQALPQEKFRTAVPGFGQPSVRAQLVHIFGVEREWVRSVQGLPWEPDDMDALGTPAELLAFALRVKAATAEWLRSETAEALNARREVDVDGTKYSGTPAEMLIHLITHAFHHKGQVAAMCRLLGMPLQDTDIIWIECQRIWSEEPKSVD